MIELHLEGQPVNEEHSDVLQDHGHVLPIPQAAGEQRYGALDALPHCLPAHRGICSHLAALQGLHLPVD